MSIKVDKSYLPNRVEALAHQKGYTADKLPLKDLPQKTYDIIKDATAWATACLHNDVEKKIDLAGRITNYVDSSLSLFRTSLNIMTLIAGRFGELFSWGKWALWAKIITLPYGIVYFVLALIEAIYETTNLIRSFKMVLDLHSSDWNQDSVLLEDLKNLRSRFFQLSDAERSQLQVFIDRASREGVPDEMLQEKFNEICEKALAIKYAALARRISPWCAHEVSLNLNDLIADLKHHPNPAHQQNARIRAHELLKNVEIQAQKRIIIHILALVALAFFVTSMILILAAFPITQFVFSLTAIGLVLTTLRHVIDRALIPQPGWNFSLQACLPDCLVSKGKTEPVAHRL